MLSLTDMFCGAGGSSTGAIQVPGVTVKTAMNHWARAIETHNANHPETDHVCADIQITDPRYIATSDILWASPECTNHSVAKGKKRVTNQADLFGDSIADEAADRSRATMWDVPRFAEWHKYKLIITENVVDAAKWVMFDAWLMAMDALGYQHHIVYMNSMHAQLGGLPAPQSRDRMYVMFWLKGNRRPNFDLLMPLANCTTCDETVRCVQSWKNPNYRWGRYKAQYVYRCPNTKCKNSIVEPGWLPAASAIDWSLRGQRIGDRTKPLVPNTMARIKAGLDKYGKQPMHLAAAGNTYDSASGKGGSYYRIWPTTESLKTLTGTTEHGLILDSVRGSNIMSDTSEPLATQTTSTTDRFAMVTTIRGTSPEHLAASNAPTTDPFGTFSAGGQHHAVTEWTVPDVMDCEFRMLEPHEITAGMAFPKDYVMTGTKREQVKQAGNAVTPPAARDLITIAAESLTPA